MITGRSCTVTLASGALLVSAAACDHKTTPRPDPPPAPATSASTQAGAQAIDTAAALLDRTAGRVPTFVVEPLAYDGKGSGAQIFPVEGAIMVADGRRVGRIVEDHVEWLPQLIPKETPGAGDNHIRGVGGVWPDAIDVLYTSSNGRMLAPTFFPLTGKGRGYTAAPGGGIGDIIGVARMGASTLVASWDGDGTRIVSVRGPPVSRVPMSAPRAGCKKGEVWRDDVDPPPPALRPFTIEGTLVTIGRLCDKRAPTAEVWDKDGKSRFVDLSPWLKEPGWRLLRGQGDDLWHLADPFRPMLHFHGATVTPLPVPPRPLQEAFVSGSDVLHASDGRTVFRLENAVWIASGRLPGSASFSGFFFDGDTLLARLERKIVKLKPGPPRDDDAGEETMESCPTPFVLLYSVSSKNEKNFTYPATRKALAGFPEVADLRLVEFTDVSRRLGVQVRTKAQGEALIAHLKQTMKDEEPLLFCYEPKDPRRIPG